MEKNTIYNVHSSAPKIPKERRQRIRNYCYDLMLISLPLLSCLESLRWFMDFVLRFHWLSCFHVRGLKNSLENKALNRRNYSAGSVFSKFILLSGSFLFIRRRQQQQQVFRVWKQRRPTGTYYGQEKVGSRAFPIWQYYLWCSKNQSFLNK